jgi:hypothetical protein
MALHGIKHSDSRHNDTQHINAHFCILIDYKGCHRQGVAIYNKNLGFIEQKKCVSEHCRKVQTIKNLFIDIIFVIKNYNDLFRAAPISAC